MTHLTCNGCLRVFLTQFRNRTDCKRCNKSFRQWYAIPSTGYRKCEREECNVMLPLSHIAVYCSNQCALLDA